MGQTKWSMPPPQQAPDMTDATPLHLEGGGFTPEESGPIGRAPFSGQPIDTRLVTTAVSRLDLDHQEAHPAPQNMNTKNQSYPIRVGKDDHPAPACSSHPRLSASSSSSGATKKRASMDMNATVGDTLKEIVRERSRKATAQELLALSPISRKHRESAGFPKKKSKT